MAEAEFTQPPTTLLFHDGELLDVRNLLGDIGASFTERRGVLLPEDRNTGFDLAIATPQRMLGLHLDAGATKPTQIAVCDSDTRSLRNSLHRAGIELMIRRPVHPAALRAIVLHALYRGPERRRNARVSIGAPVRFRAGWRQRQALLADLSIGGFRLLTPHEVDRGKNVTLQLPVEVTSTKPLSLKAKTLRCFENEGDGEFTLTGRFESMSQSQFDAVKAVLRSHAQGPATFESGAPARAEAPAEAAIPQEPTEPRGALPEAGAGAERRAAPRHSIERRVIALGEDATRVLIGRDISIGGMRVNPNPLLRVGEDVQLAIHVGTQDVPLVVRARVHRDDGERGVVLRFHQLDPEGTQLLDEMLDSLPMIEPGDDSHAEGMIVSEILPEAQ